MNLEDYCATIFQDGLPETHNAPWDIIQNLESTVWELLDTLPEEYDISGGVAIHASAIVDPSTIIKEPAIIGKDCFVGPHGLIRGGVIMAEKASIGASCEVKRTVLGAKSHLGHFNFIGDSVVGTNVNVEAGAVVANHFNERRPKDQAIRVRVDNQIIETNTTRFGAVIGDHSRVGANAVLTPGTILKPGTIVPRLGLVDQAA
jgi:NDP-sugar pyrophosphorylase family protein